MQQPYTVPTHAYCTTCDRITRVDVEQRSRQATGGFLGGDVECLDCRTVLVTLFHKIIPGTPS